MNQPEKFVGAFLGSLPDSKELTRLEAASSNLDVNRTPPNELRHWYAINDDERYIQHGKGQAQTYRQCYENILGPFKATDSLLDFGCSSGRVLRHFIDDAKAGVECWGADIDGGAIGWARANLGPHLNWLVNTTHPHFPFEDHYFNLIYGNSIFTHIGETAEAWFLELRRVLKKGGIAALSFNDENSYKYLANQGAIETNAAMKVLRDHNCDLTVTGAAIIDINPDRKGLFYNPRESVWYNSKYIKSVFGRIMPLIQYHKNRVGHQSIYVFQKPG